MASVSTTEMLQSATNLKPFIQQAQKIVGERFVLHSPEELAVYDCDGCTLIKHPPDLVVLPKTTEQVAQLVKLCDQYQIPFIARGGGTGLSGGALPVNGGVVIGLNRMDSIVAIDTENQTATVEVGVVNAWLNRDLAPHHLFYGPDPSSQAACTLGGNIAENAGGIHCVKHGVTVDHILALEVVLPDGSVTWLGSQNRRHHGFNWVGLMVGSEGTLGIVTKAIVRLLPKPAGVKVLLACFDTPEAATNAVMGIIKSGLTPAALEYMDAFTVKAVNEAFDVGFPEQSEAVLLIELEGTPEQLMRQELQLHTVLKLFGVTQTQTGSTEAERQKLWAARKGAVAAYGRYFPAFYLHDCVIPRSKLTQIITKINDIAKEYKLTIGNVFHAGDGNLHPNILFDPDNKAKLPDVLDGGEAILKACLEVGGVLSGEHGIGLEKSGFMPLQFSPEELDKMKALKGLLDPKGLANPAKIFPVRASCGETRMTLTHKMLATQGLWI